MKSTTDFFKGQQINQHPIQGQQVRHGHYNDYYGNYIHQNTGLNPIRYFDIPGTENNSTGWTSYQQHGYTTCRHTGSNY